MRLIDADALRQVLEVFTEKDTLGHTPLQLCDAMPAASPWHRVEDELPSMDGYDWVLGVVNGGCRNLKYENAIMEVSYDPEYKEWFIDDLPEAKITVTHWMPLPEPPKEDA